MQALAVTSTKAPTALQAAIIATKHEHPDLSTRDIAKLNDTVHSHVVRTLSEYGIETERVERYKSARADILAGMQERVLRTKYGTDDDIKSMPDSAAILLFNSCFNNERLERGQATENVLNVNVVKTLDDRSRSLQEAMQALSAPLDIVPSPDNGSNHRDNVSPALEHKQGGMQAIDITATNDAVSDNIYTVNLRENVRDAGQGEPGQRRKGRPRKG